MTVHHNELANCYRRIRNKIILNCAIALQSEQGSVVTIWYHDADAPSYEKTSLSKDHIRKHARGKPSFLDESGYYSVSAYGITIDHLLHLMNIKSWDILFIDAEGVDSGLILAPDLCCKHVKNIYFENLRLPEGRANKGSKVYKYLSSNGYEIEYQALSSGWTSHACRR
jgi:hypothetical protein